MKGFKKNLRYVFTKKKFIRSSDRTCYAENKEWVDRLNGREVDVVTQLSGFIGFKVVVNVWCKCIGKR